MATHAQKAAWQRQRQHSQQQQQQQQPQQQQWQWFQQQQQQQPSPSPMVAMVPYDVWMQHQLLMQQQQQQQPQAPPPFLLQPSPMSQPSMMPSPHLSAMPMTLPYLQPLQQQQPQQQQQQYPSTYSSGPSLPLRHTQASMQLPYGDHAYSAPAHLSSSTATPTSSHPPIANPAHIQSLVQQLHKRRQRGQSHDASTSSRGTLHAPFSTQERAQWLKSLTSTAPEHHLPAGTQTNYTPYTGQDYAAVAHRDRTMRLSQSLGPNDGDPDTEARRTKQEKQQMYANQVREFMRAQRDRTVTS
ncbi:hypothetical protein RI367_007891 [Sorochytrium milnesiophthora]